MTYLEVPWYFVGSDNGYSRVLHTGGTAWW